MAGPHQSLQLNALRAFEAAGRHLHMARAAEELGVTQSAVSHQIRGLEARLGLRLFERGHNRIRLTPDGARLLPVISESFDRMHQGLLALDPDSSAGVLTLACTPSLAANWLVPQLGAFAARFPELEIDLRLGELDDPNLEPDVDLTICYGERPTTTRLATTRRVRRLTHVSFFPVCSPRLLRGEPPLRRPRDLLAHRLIHDDDGGNWRRWLAAAGVATETKGTARAPGLYLWNAHLTLLSARGGGGIALADTMEVGPDLRDGSLVPLFDIEVPAPRAYYLVTPPEEEMPLRAREFERWLFELTAGGAI